MDKIEGLTKIINQEEIYSIRVEYESKDLDKDVPYISIRSFDHYGKEPIHDIIDLINVTEKYIDLNPSCYFNILSEVIQKREINKDIYIRNFNFFNIFILESQNIKSSITISDTFFKDNVMFTKSVFNEIIKLERCVFEKHVSFQSAFFRNGFDFKNVNFNYICSFNQLNNKESEPCSSISLSSFNLRNIEFKDRVFFNDAKFRKALYLKNCKFHEKVQFHSVNFLNTANFDNTTFYNLVDFYYAEFNSPQIFHLTDFLDRAIFSNTVFHNQLSFIHCKTQTDSFINFESAEFKQSLDISRANFNCETNFWNIKIEKKSIIPNQFNVYNTDGLEDISNDLISKKALQKLRESYRIIKNSLRKSGNEINALKFKSYEMIVFERELRLWDKGKTILFFSKWSNHHGLNWGRGFLFTVFSACVFLYIFLIIPNNGLEWSCTRQARLETLSAFVQFLNLTEWNPILWGKDINSYNYGYLVLFCSRIFISYGYYQTISAFRRYGRN
ncbi:pentapeptide repeat-containing protein [Marinilabilia salmonicolor]|uniref:pentapeptide repeat-containing protein n=1 Tax=Marinilabilia salmonicolor TaxID=989 RepID=UPI00029A34D2|nr:pentapeptide repeat-containing protein [Marinilabilia salmonicolor]